MKTLVGNPDPERPTSDVSRVMSAAFASVTSIASRMGQLASVVPLARGKLEAICDAHLAQTLDVISTVGRAR